MCPSSSCVSNEFAWTKLAAQAQQASGMRHCVSSANTCAGTCASRDCQAGAVASSPDPVLPLDQPHSLTLDQPHAPNPITTLVRMRESPAERYL